MQPNQLSQFLAMLWATGSSLPDELCTASQRLADRAVFAATHSAEVAVESELTAAIQNPAITQITLTSDVILMFGLVINREEPLTLDLNGCKIASLRANDSAIDLQTGHLTITGQGSIVSNGLGASGVRIKGAMTAENTHYSSLTIDENVTLYAPHAYGIYLAANFQAAYGVEITLKGKIVAKSGIGINRLVQGKGEHVPKITISDSATIEVDSDEGVALSAAGYGDWQIGAATITGATGVSIKAGRLNFTGAKISATGELANPSGWDNSVGVGAVVQIEDSDEYAGDIQLNFDGGEYTSRQSYFVAKYGTGAALQKLTIKSGNFRTPSGVFYGIAPQSSKSTNKSEQVVAISGGTFLALDATDLTDYLAKGLYLDTNRKTGAVTVIDPNPPEAEIDPVEELALECQTLENLIARAKVYLSKKYAGDELGEWQDLANKSVGAVKRAVKASEKLLQSSKSVVLEQVLHLEKRLKAAMQEVETVADEMRGEMLSVLTTAQELDPQEYSAYSYNALKEAIVAALTLTAQPEASFNQLYSVFCDLQLNIDLLEEPEDELDVALPKPLGLPEPLELPDILPLPALTPAPTLAAALASGPKTNLDLVEPELLPVERQALLELGASVALTILEYDLAEEIAAAAEVETEVAPEPETIIEAIESVVESPDSTELTEAESLAETVADVDDDLTLAALDEARVSLNLMVDAVRDLALKDYQAEHAEQFGELQVAIVKADALLQKTDATLPEILDAMDEVKFATAGLELGAATEKSTPSLASVDSTRLGTVALAAMSRTPEADTANGAADWTALREVVADIAKLEAADYTAATYANVLNNLARAKTLLANPTAAQSDVDDVVFDLNIALLGLERNVQAPVSQQFTRPIIASDSPTLTRQADIFADTSVTPSLLMSMMAGAYAGLATYRKSRLAAKQSKRAM